jgi:uncharacterized protein (DUF2147 family)
MRLTIGTLLVAGLALASVAHAQPTRSAPTTAAGVWEQVDEKGRVGAWLRLTERNGVYEGSIVKTFPEPGENPNAACAKCKGGEKNAPVLGLTIIKGMQRSGRAYENGTILDPRDGSVYDAQMELSPDGQRLSVRGYVGIPLLGRSQVWRRLPDNAAGDTVGRR